MTRHQQIKALVNLKFSEATAELLTEDQTCHRKFLKRLRTDLRGKTRRTSKREVIRQKQINPYRRQS